MSVLNVIRAFWKFSSKADKLMLAAATIIPQMIFLRPLIYNKTTTGFFIVMGSFSYIATVVATIALFYVVYKEALRRHDSSANQKSKIENKQ